MASPAKAAAVKWVKPHVGPGVWRTLQSLDPKTRQRKRDHENGVKGKREAAKGGRPRQASAAKPGATVETKHEDQDLSSIARRFGTDKWGTHRYTPHYQRHFAHLRNDRFTLLEIGIGGYSREKQGGASLRMWKEFFPNAQIIGLDIQDKSFVNEPRIAAYQGSQTNRPLLKTIVDSADDLRVVIDDGSHRPAHVRATFDILFPLLPDGALYAIEDTQTSYWPNYGGSLDLDDKTTTMALVKRLVDGLNYEEFRDEGYEPTYSDQHVVAVHCYHNLVIIEKGSNNEGTNRSARWKTPS